MVTIERISSGAQQCGEGPHWDEASQTLIYVEVIGQNILRWDERLQKETKLHIASDPVPSSTISGYTTLVVPVQGRPDSYVISRGSRLATLQWDGSSQQHTVTNFAQVDQHVTQPMCLNDGKCDPEGTLWSGTMGKESVPGVSPEGAGSIYSFSSRDGSGTARLEGITLSNGLAWSSDATRFFYIDTCAMKVDVFDYDIANTSISNRRCVYDVSARRTPGLPDGMTVDSRGRLWVALFFGSRVICLDPVTGQVAETLHLPATNITSCTFGGPGLDALYVTSATVGLEAWQRGAQPDAGATFRVTGLGVTGTANVGWKVDYDALQSL